MCCRLFLPQCVEEIYSVSILQGVLLLFNDRITLVLSSIHIGRTYQILALLAGLIVLSTLPCYHVSDLFIRGSEIRKSVAILHYIIFFRA